MKTLSKILIFFLCLTKSATASADATSTETVYLSGHDADDPVEWQFRCSSGRNSGKWSKIGVPSCWEQQGFGAYTYGRFYLDKTAKPSDETGEYRTRFKAPSDWKGRRVEIVFEGVMTDADVKINGKQAGDVHQGAFTAFSYDISDLLRYGASNTLEVTVSKESADKSVNAAERRADWWLFGGIYRPVYLRVLPETHIARVALDARADGTLNVDLHTRNLAERCSIEATLDGEKTLATPLAKSDINHLTFRWPDVSTWDPEHPNLHTIIFSLRDKSGKLLHSHSERVGFRTLEFRRRDGFYLNGTKLVMKGVNRHCFYSETGRATSRRRDLEDIRLIKGMNANAIRSHYSPDRHLLELCDSMGILYFDELAGWHDAYSTEVGKKIVEEMVTHDANHPCIFAWGNGNEGGFNKDFIPLFHQFDPQQRLVAQAWSLSGGIDTHHYPAWQTGVARMANGYEVFMPTEFLHSQYDKGAGAGLEDFWTNYSASPLFAGGFIWAWADEGVRRADLDGKIDNDGGNAPDGIVGPHREKEGSWYTIRDIWSPVQIAPATVRRDREARLSLSNKSLFTPLSDYTLGYDIVDADIDNGEIILTSGKVALPPAQPGETANVTVARAKQLNDADFLRLILTDAQNDTVNVWTYPLLYADEYQAGRKSTQTDGRASVEGMTLMAAGTRASFDSENGMLTEVEHNGRKIPFGNGPVPVGMKMELKSISSRMDGDTAVIAMRYRGAADSIIWRMTPDGILHMDALLLNSKNGHGFKGSFIDDEIRNFGLTFSYPEASCKGMTWYGKGPYRVWRNRRRGTNFGVWHKDYNNTVTGQPDEAGRLIYPEFKGYHANVYDVRIESDEAPMRISSHTDGLYLRMFTPEEPKVRATATMVEFPEGDISFLLDIPPMRSYKPLEQIGPGAIPPHVRINPGDEGIHIRLSFDFNQSH